MNRTITDGWNLLEQLSRAERHCIPYNFHKAYLPAPLHSVCTVSTCDSSENNHNQQDVISSENHQRQTNSRPVASKTQSPDVHAMFQQLLHNQTSSKTSTAEISEKLTQLYLKIDELEQRLQMVEYNFPPTKTSDSTVQQNLEDDYEVAEDSNFQGEGACFKATKTVQTDELPLQLKTESYHASENLKMNHFYEYKSDSENSENSEQYENSHEESDEEYVARFIRNKKETEDMMITPNLPWIQKLGDPGTFTIPCTIGKLSFPKCMCDLGASISTMPVSIVKTLGLTNFKPDRVTIQLADQSTTECLGILEDVPVVVDYVIIPTDFAVIAMHDETPHPLLLGRPFLTSTGALIDCTKGTVQLRISEFRKPTFTRKGEILNGTPELEDSDGSLSSDDENCSLESEPPNTENSHGFRNLFQPNGTLRIREMPRDLEKWPTEDSPRAKEEMNEYLDSEPEVMMLEKIDIEPGDNAVNNLPFGEDTFSCLDPYPAKLKRNPELPRLNVLEKLDDPGALTLPCSVADLHFPRCLCDTGSSINVMPLSIAARIGFRNFPAKNIPLRLADQSKVNTYGILPSIPVVVEGVEVPTDFVIIKMNREPDYGLLLGRPFLRTTCADLDIMTGTIALNLGTSARTIFTKYGSVISMSPERKSSQSDNLMSSSEKGRYQVWNPEEDWDLDRYPDSP